MIRKFSLIALLLATPALFALPKAAPVIPDGLRTMIEAPFWPAAVPDPTGSQVLYLQRAPVVPLELLAAPALGLAGEQIDPKFWGVKRRNIMSNPSVLSLQTRKNVALKVPQNKHVEHYRFSPNGRFLALSVDAESGVEVWIADASNGSARRVEKLFLNDSFTEQPLVWSSNSETLYVTARENYRENLRAVEFDGPTIEEAEGTRVPARTYAYLLRTADDQKLFQKVARSQVTAIQAKTLKTNKIGSAQTVAAFSLSPDGERMLVESYAAPYSLAVPAQLFGRDIQVLTLKNGVSQKVLQMPLAETVPPEGERVGPRDIRWQPDHGARLLWWEALDDGDPRKKVPYRDRLMSWEYPFAGAAREELKTEERAVDINFLPIADQITVHDTSPDTYRSRIDWVDLKNNRRRRIQDIEITDAYRHPGRFVEASDANGQSRLVMDGDRLFLAGEGRNPKGEQPFLDAFELSSGKTTRLFQSAADQPYIETFSFMIDRKPQSIMVIRQASDSPPNLWSLDLASGKREQISKVLDNVPEMTKAKKQPLVYQRADGITLSGTLYLPHNYVPGTKLPAIVWAYPEEFRSKDNAGQVRVSDKRYSRPSPIGVEWFVTQGYAVLTNAAMPVVGDKETVNNTFVQQIVSNAEAAIDAMDKLGVVDRKRVAIGGHSYGAFMTANLLAHSNLFCAGIARSGAYNRSLTPFGFQSERRTFWEAKDFYMMVSPFAEADKIKTPLLLIHGKNDNNPGTSPIQTERMFQAVRGVGGVARMVMLPYESHAYRAKENVELVQGESLDWLNRNCGPSRATAAE